MIGSFTNHLLGGVKGQPTPEVGMGCTILMCTDRHACTIIKISPSGHRLTVQEDTAKRTDSNGMSECQQYEYSANPEGRVLTFTRRKNGQYREANGTSALRLGDRQHYYDFSF